jgi:predicted XRE-type DNA-binding protein
MTVSDDDMTPIRGSGNVFRDFGRPNADLRQLKALLAAHIIGVLDERKLTVRQAQDLTGVDASDFSRIRKVKLERFTIERLADMLGKFGEEVEIQVTFRGASRSRPAEMLEPA